MNQMVTGDEYFKKPSGVRKMNELFRKILTNRFFMVGESLIAAAVLAYATSFTDNETEHNILSLGALFFALIISASLVVCDDITVNALPFMLISVIVLPCYDGYSTFIRYIFLAPIPLAALIFHFIYYSRPFAVGPSITGIGAIAVAVTLGGLFTIPIKDYFSLNALYYTFALGIGMCLVYLLLKPYIVERYKHNIGDYIADVMVIISILIFIEIVLLYIRGARIDIDKYDYDRFISQIYPISLSRHYIHNTDVNLQPGNNLSTILMACIPFLFYKTVKKNFAFVLTILLSVASLYLAYSRGGMLLGAVEIVICMLIFAFFFKHKPVRMIFIALSVILMAFGAYLLISRFSEGSIVTSTEVRVVLLKRSFKDFLSNPVFGTGLGHQGNRDIYPGKVGTLIWYHMMLPQIWGSLGLLGVAAYAWDLFVRIKLTVRKLSPITVTFAMSYLGLLLISLVNPGLFCPMPYAFIAVVLFIYIENSPDRLKRIKDR